MMRQPFLHHIALISALTAVAFHHSTTPTAVAAFSPATLQCPSETRNRMKRDSSSLGLLLSWSKGTEILQLDPSDLCKDGDDGAPRLAKDEEYASAVVKAWRNELAKRTSRSVASPLTYECKTDGSSLHGHIYRPPYIYQPPADGSSREKYLPGVVLFHTGAGPQDVFLRWKADSLVNAQDVFGNKGCVVLIADIIGDSNGWAWHDRSKYENIRKSILVPDEKGERKQLMGRVQAAIETLSSQPGVDPERIGAMGFCLGGHPILELARMKDPSAKAMTTFHGVFDGVRKLSSVETSADVGKCNIVVCTGEDDPFVPKEDLDAAMMMFNDLGYRSNVMKFERTRHGFTNPAQDFNPSDSFAYNEEANTKAWSAALSLLNSI